MLKKCISSDCNRLPFLIGVLTTRRTMLSLIAIFANHPDIQKKIYNEIDAVIGRNKPRLQDRSEMHYTSAVRKLPVVIVPSKCAIIDLQSFNPRESRTRHSFLIYQKYSFITKFHSLF